MARVYLGLGSNIDPEINLRLGIAELRQRYGELDLSSVYRSAAVGFEGPDFLNLVVGLNTGEPPLAVQDAIAAIHVKAGRVHGEERFSSRPLDIDLLLYDDLILQESPIRLPRADVLDYSFVLGPLAELDPDLKHPVTGKTMREHWRQFDQESHPLRQVCVDF